ncbi:MAG: DNA helicase RecQ [Bacteroidota bacterium]
MTKLQQATTALQHYYGYDTFRPMQKDIITSVFETNDTVVLMPTGGGKSICYQLPAIVMPGTCIVISPLISLMKDQVEGLKSNGVAAAYLNSTQSTSEARAVEDALIQQKLDLLYISPEKITGGSISSVLKSIKVNLIAVDEAHCISAWGHDFRPEYTKLKMLKQQFPQTPFIALTATADKLTRKDIQMQLCMEHPKVFIASFDRPNLSLTVRPGQKRFEQIIDFIKERPDQSGIIYCLSRKSTENLAEKLNGKGVSAEAYHAGLSPKDRSLVQENFINDTTPIVCATIAFGMGIDKSNVRWVIHYNLPKNLEGYYQEIGRAGRDGIAADTLLFYSFQDVMMMRDMLEQSKGENAELQLAKLDRMRQYAEAPTCRRRMLLSYFSEDLDKDCGNCDICNDPPEAIDGTVIAQKALSAIHRLRQQVSMGVLIDVLRGSSRREIIEKGYHKIKTYGAGRDIPQSHWQQYLLQLLNLGYIEIAYQSYNQVRLTPSSKHVLFEGRTVSLVMPATIRKRQEKEKEAAKKKRSTTTVNDELFQLLRQLRKRLSQEKGIPPYRIFSDATLIDMVEKKPLSDAEMLQVHGVGEQKLASYGDAFRDIIMDFVRQKTKSIKGSTYQLTLHMLQAGKNVAEIAEERALNTMTIFSHLAHLFENGHPVDLSPYVSMADIDAIRKAFRYVEQPIKMKDVYLYLDEKFSYDQIRLALAYHNRNKQVG